MHEVAEAKVSRLKRASRRSIFLVPDYSTEPATSTEIESSHGAVAIGEIGDRDGNGGGQKANGQKHHAFARWPERYTKCLNNYPTKSKK